VARTVGSSTLDPAQVKRLAEVHRGELITPGDAGYDEARNLYNAMIDRRPGLIARCAGAADVIAVVGFAREQGWDLAVRGGGHNLPGTSVCDGGVVIDCSALRSIRVDPEARSARAEPGLRWLDFDAETQAFGLATTGGTFSDTGISGLTLGGGMGWLGGHYGLASDNLVAADVVSADGRLLRASADEHPDLFWALRGGGGNFGVVTSFEYRLHPVGPVLGGLVAHPFERAREVLRFYQEFSSAMPDELSTACSFLTHPEAGPAVGMAAVWSGPVDQGEKVLKPLHDFGPPVEDTIAVVPYRAVQTMLDPLCPPGLRYYAKGLYVDDLTDVLIDATIEHFARVTSPRSLVIIQYKGGQMGRGPADRTAFGHRDARHLFVAWSAWEDPREDDRHVAWARGLAEAVEPVGAGGEYVNDLGLETEEGHARIRAGFGANYDRLAKLKAKYDPDNLFHHNQNIRPEP